MKKGLFITIEGPDGSGKTTQSKLLVEYLKKKGYSVVHTREPGGTSLAEFLREVILNPDLKIAPVTELLLYSASRAQHTIELIKPSLQERKIVVCERYTGATIAYQGYGRGLDIELIKKLNRIATGGLTPDLTIILDVPVEKGLRRIKKGRNHDRLEKESLEFHRRVRQGYLALAKESPEKIKVVSSSDNIDLTHKRIVKVVEKYLKKYRADN